MLQETLLILDLDETLIHASATKIREDFDFQVFHYFVYKRPGLVEFLITCAQYFKLAIWSSASDDYVQAVVRQILPAEVTPAFVWGRSRCTPFTTLQLDEYGYYDLDGTSSYEYAKRLKKSGGAGFHCPKPSSWMTPQPRCSRIMAMPFTSSPTTERRPTKS